MFLKESELLLETKYKKPHYLTDEEAKTNFKINNVPILLAAHTEYNEVEETLNNLKKDYNFMNTNYKNLIIKHFLPWLMWNNKNCPYKDEDLFNQLILYEITYEMYGDYNKFAFCFESNKNSYLYKNNILNQAAECNIYVKNNKFIKSSCYDI